MAIRVPESRSIRVIPTEAFCFSGPFVQDQLRVLPVDRVVRALAECVVSEVARGVVMVQVRSGRRGSEEVRLDADSVTSTPNVQGVVTLKEVHPSPHSPSDCVLWRPSTAGGGSSCTLSNDMWLVSIAEVLRAVCALRPGAPSETDAVTDLLSVLFSNGLWAAAMKEIVSVWCHAVASELSRVCRQLTHTNTGAWTGAVARARARVLVATGFDLPSALLPEVLLVVVGIRGTKGGFQSEVRDNDVGATTIVRMTDKGCVDRVFKYMPTGAARVVVGVRPSVPADTWATKCLLGMLGAGSLFGGILSGVGTQGRDGHEVGKVVCDNPDEAGVDGATALVRVALHKVAAEDGWQRDSLASFVSFLKRAKASQDEAIRSAENTTRMSKRARADEDEDEDEDEGGAGESKTAPVGDDSVEIVDPGASPASPLVGIEGELLLKRSVVAKITRGASKFGIVRDGAVDSILLQEQGRFERWVDAINKTLVFHAGSPAYTPQSVPYSNNSCFFAATVSMLLADLGFRQKWLAIPPLGFHGTESLQTRTVRAIKVCLYHIASGRAYSGGSDLVQTLMELVSFLGVDEPDGVKVDNSRRVVEVGFLRFTARGFVLLGEQDDVGVAVVQMKRALGTAINVKMAAQSTMKYECEHGHSFKTSNIYDLKATASTFDAVDLPGRDTTVSLIVGELVANRHKTDTPGRMCESCADAKSIGYRKSVIESISGSVVADSVVRALATEKYPGRGLDAVEFDGPHFVDFISSLKGHLGSRGAHEIEGKVADISGGSETTTSDLDLSVGDLMLLDLEMTTLEYDLTFEEENFSVTSSSGNSKTLSIVALAVKTGGVTSGHWFSIVKETGGGWSIVNGTDVRHFDTLARAVDDAKRSGGRAIPYVMLRREADAATPSLGVFGFDDLL